MVGALLAAALATATPTYGVHLASGLYLGDFTSDGWQPVLIAGPGVDFGIRLDAVAVTIRLTAVAGGFPGVVGFQLPAGGDGSVSVQYALPAVPVLSVGGSLGLSGGLFCLNRHGGDIVDCGRTATRLGFDLQYDFRAAPEEGRWFARGEASAFYFGDLSVATTVAVGFRY